MNIADALSGRAKLEGIQWVLLSATTRRALQGQLRALLSAGATLEPCHLRDATCRTGRKLTGYYDARVHIQGTEAYRVRPIAVTWALRGEADRCQGGDDLAEMQAEAVRQGVAAPFRQLTADLPEWNMHIQVSPLDVRFPQLVRLSDTRHVRDMNAADLVVTMGGYNSIIEVMRLRKKALVIPRPGPRAEQIMRARLFEQRGLIDVIYPQELTPKRLAERLLTDLERDDYPVYDEAIELDGAAQAAAHLTQLLGERVYETAAD